MAHSQQLEEKQKVMEERMSTATADMTRITDDFMKQKEILRENDAILDSLRRENERLKMQVCEVIMMISFVGSIIVF